MKVAIILSVAFVTGTAIVSLVWLVTSDFRARAATQQARYEALSQVVANWFHLVEQADVPDGRTPVTEKSGLQLRAKIGG